MKKTITAILAIALMAIPLSAIAHIETWAEYDKRLEKLIAEDQDKLPIKIGEKDDDGVNMRITKVVKRGKVIITTLDVTGKYGWIAMAKEMGGVERFKAQQQRILAERAIEVHGLKIVRWYTLRYIYVDGGKQICTVDVNRFIIMGMIMDIPWEGNDWPKYKPQPLPQRLWEAHNQYKKYLYKGGYPPAGLSEDDLHIIREYEKYRIKDTQ